jgi:multidrug efflux pump subunit AcrA (membrane-fusion protein)
MSVVSRRAGRVVAVGLIVAVVGATAAWAGVTATSASTSSSAGGTRADGTGLATVVRADLASQQTIPGTVGYDGAWTVVLPGGTTAAAVAQAQLRVTTDQLTLDADRTSLQDTTAADAQTTAADQQAVATAQAAEGPDQAQLHGDQASLQAAQAHAVSACGSGPTACAAEQQTVAQWQARVAADTQAADRDQTTLQQADAGLTGALQHAAQAEHQAEAQVAAAGANLAADQAALATGQRTALDPGVTFTGLPAVGQVVRQGQPLYALEGRSVPLLYGPVPQWRSLRPGMDDGPDVAELNQALTALGFEPGVSAAAHFTDATTAGIRRLQSSLGLGQTGVLLLGEVAFEPGPLRIAGVNVHPGSPAQPGTAVLDATSTALVVTALVPLSDVGSVKPGAGVTVDLPDGRTGVPGSVRDVGTSVNPGPGGGGAGGSGSGATNGAAGGQGGAGATSVAATVTFSDPTIAQGLDQAAVLVHVTTQTARDALAVPVEALLALDGGGEGVEVVTGGVHRIVAVQTGLFAGTQVQIAAPGIDVGTQVEVPAP